MYSLKRVLDWQNDQSITLAADTNAPDICLVKGELRMLMRARRLGQAIDMPIACYRTKKSSLLYITGTRIAALLCEAAKKVRPTTPTDELKRYSAHSLRVWACVLLDEAGMSPAFIQKRRRHMQGVCQPSYAMDGHMEPSSLRYHCRC
jgi:hypothetical protein